MAKEQAKSIANEARLSEELKAMQWEPLLPVEKKLIVWSISLGIVLLGLLVWQAMFSSQVAIEVRSNYFWREVGKKACRPG